MADQTTATGPIAVMGQISEPACYWRMNRHSPGGQASSGKMPLPGGQREPGPGVEVMLGATGDRPYLVEWKAQGAPR
jgi:hypothetical protein